MELLLVGGREDCTLDGLMKAIVMKAIVMMAMMMKLPTMVNMVVIMVTGIGMKSNCRNTGDYNQLLKTERHDFFLVSGCLKPHLD